MIFYFSKESVIRMSVISSMGSYVFYYLYLIRLLKIDLLIKLQVKFYLIF